MPIDFPNSPTNGQTFTSGSSSWVYNSTQNTWAASASIPASSLTGTTLSATVTGSSLTSVGALTGLTMATSANITFPSLSNTGLQNSGSGSTLSYFHLDRGVSGNAQWKTKTGAGAFIDADTITLRGSGGGTTFLTVTTGTITIGAAIDLVTAAPTTANPNMTLTSSATGPTSPASGDLWNLSGVLKFHNGTTTRDIAFTESYVAYTGTAKQNVTLTATTSNLFYCQENKAVHAQGRWAFTSAGTASNALLIDTTTLPLPAVAGVVGFFHYFDSGNQFFFGAVSMSATGQLSFASHGGNNNFGQGPAITVASGDSIDINLSYRSV